MTPPPPAPLSPAEAVQALAEVTRSIRRLSDSGDAGRMVEEDAAQLEAILASLQAAPVAETPDDTQAQRADELLAVRQILAADMTRLPTTEPLPEPNRPIGLTALGVYHLVQEVRQLRAPAPPVADARPG